MKPKYMAWFKDGELLHSIPVNRLSSELKFKSIVVNTDHVRNAGNYTCLLAVKMYGVLDHNESDSTIVTCTYRIISCVYIRMNIFIFMNIFVFMCKIRCQFKPGFAKGIIYVPSTLLSYINTREFF